MKLPKELERPFLFHRRVDLVEAIVRHCAEVCIDQAEAVCLGYDGPAPVKARMCAAAILADFGLEEAPGHTDLMIPPEAIAAMDMPDTTPSAGPTPLGAEIDRLRVESADLRRQEPVAFMLPMESLNHLQVESIYRLIARCKHAHYTDVIVRINGTDERYQVDWIKHLRAAPAAPESLALLREIDESGVLFKHAMDLDAKVANYLHAQANK